MRQSRELTDVVGWTLVLPQMPVTSVAAHFNLIPAALLELPDRYGVIKGQASTAMIVLVVNMCPLYYLI
ncbi:membrane protein [Caballeronia udeis]|uniref:Membrane protein n=1 Tax=Caballeronia udeis TaxID=1232866 RepID=A0A158GS49_9BURK|nr:DUF979 family protein [Caballeronia udeis]SAL34895.1 membrane protein [Caballeronia udeis]